VKREDLPLFHALIAAFGERTGVPVVLNTSFNRRGEPIVERPEEAIDVYLGSEMDALALGPYLVEKSGAHA
jgi:carbamoyltransferase